MFIVTLLDRTLFRGVSGLAQLLLLTALAAAFYQVVARFVLASPSDWSEAWTRAAIIWTVMLGLCLAFRQGAMLSVEMLRSVLTPPARRRLDTVVMLVCIGFLGLLAWLGAQMTWRVRFQTMPSFDVAISWVYVAIPVGAVLAIVAVLARWAERGPDAAVDDTTL